ncbi:tRNA lysidine(34) synthetase TilS [Arsenicitalea aurantiaca]|uniref:tRNA(Ile)-lysidine synthase n=1 Tax=Arsenicitalea aurantiaca TaxID=1783274 RepID=A0A433XKS8_9HYPH|nr:tRNA lysidine(34) synthetase TilS [Arsenicitalea aurantiaca]RUT34663.1 tRNA lysidine(34) synthetase TilS [Arsenicitalea aurantiaca]
MPALESVEPDFSALETERCIGLAVSGGADSLALMILAQRWADAQPDGPRLVVYSVDHGLRAEAAGEVRAVCEMAARLGLSARALRWDEPKPSSGIQAAARRARYRLIGAAMKADGVTWLATGHHLEDQAETVLMRLAHGSGLEGLRGMDALTVVEDVQVVRPLLGVPRERLRAVVDAAGFTPFEDPSNADTRFERVRWREAMPALSALGLDPGTLARFSRRAGEADLALRHCAEEAFKAHVAREEAGLSIARDSYAALPRAIAVRLLGAMLAELGDPHKVRLLAPVERLATKLQDEGDFPAVTLHGCRIAIRKGRIHVAREAGRLRPERVQSR